MSIGCAEEEEVKTVSFSGHLSQVKEGTGQKGDNKEDGAERQVWGLLEDAFQGLHNFIVDQRGKLSLSNFSTFLAPDLILPSVHYSQEYGLSPRDKWTIL